MWQHLGDGCTYRAKIEGGWLYRYNSAPGAVPAMVFVLEEKEQIICISGEQPMFI